MLPTACLRRIARHVLGDVEPSQGLGRVTKRLHALFGSSTPPEDCTFWRRRAQRHSESPSSRSEREAFLQLCSVVARIEDIYDDTMHSGVTVHVRFDTPRRFMEVSELAYDTAYGVIDEYPRAHTWMRRNDVVAHVQHRTWVRARPRSLSIAGRGDASESARAARTRYPACTRSASAGAVRHGGGAAAAARRGQRNGHALVVRLVRVLAHLVLHDAPRARLALGQRHALGHVARVRHVDACACRLVRACHIIYKGASARTKKHPCR